MFYMPVNPAHLIFLTVNYTARTRHPAAGGSKAVGQKPPPQVMMDDDDDDYPTMTSDEAPVRPRRRQGAAPACAVALVAILTFAALRHDRIHRNG